MQPGLVLRSVTSRSFHRGGSSGPTLARRTSYSRMKLTEELMNEAMCNVLITTLKVLS